MIAYRWRELWDLVSLAGALGAIVVALPFVALLSLSLFPYAWRGGARVLPTATKIFLALLCIGELAALILVEWSRWKLTRLLTGVDHEAGLYGIWAVARHLEAMFTTEVAAAFAIVIAAPPLTIVVLLRVWRRYGPGVRGPIGIAVTLSAWMVWTVAFVAWALAFSQILGFHLNHEATYELAVTSFGAPLLERARGVVLGFALLATLATVVTLATSRSTTALTRWPRGSGVLAGAVWILGVLACLATRGRSYDARHPLSYADFELPVAVDVPLATRCRVPSSGPILEVDPDGAHLDGIPIARGEASDVLKAKRELWQRTHPDAPLVTLGIAAPPTTPMADVMPFVAAARQVWGAGIDQIVAPPRETVSTRTLGVLVRGTRFCSVEIVDPLASGGTWGDLSIALQRPHD